MGCLHANVANECTLIRTKTTTTRNKQTKQRTKKGVSWYSRNQCWLAFVLWVLFTVFSFFLNVSFGYINQHRMCQNTTVLQRKYVKCQNLFPPTAQHRHGSVTQKVYVRKENLQPRRSPNQGGLGTCSSRKFSKFRVSELPSPAFSAGNFQ